jgi:DNA integrity scanning protein DisA with diadenylate cyclase activity
VVINSAVTEELIRTIFFPNTALHDGAIIIQEAR